MFVCCVFASTLEIGKRNPGGPKMLCFHAVFLLIPRKWDAQPRGAGIGSGSLGTGAARDLGLMGVGRRKIRGGEVSCMMEWGSVCDADGKCSHWLECDTCGCGLDYALECLFKVGHAARHER